MPMQGTRTGLQLWMLWITVLTETLKLWKSESFFYKLVFADPSVVGRIPTPSHLPIILLVLVLDVAVRGHLITAAALTATMAYQSILSPPGGVWQDSQDGGTPGHAILDSDDNIAAARYARYLVVNSIVLVASLSTIMLAMTGFPIQNKLLTWLMIFTVYITISCMAYAYVLAMVLVSPESLWEKFKLPPDIFVGLALGWIGLCLFVLMLHSCRFMVWLVSKFVKLVKACYSCYVPRATHAGHKGAGNFC
ncbi:hypothetical protein Vadar_000634 [Vaccinium darrowii]|uniref:Uncharacterized protein n=1 Tax=Vaccinium darrowii TaxID=229202 RepID=A0ACB7YRW8_9ERIC|nr:hypothetical protein Vadar_000634 [Vaccinium darrowii]